jgi:caffeic acid 3-O-methyltransferase
MYNVLRVNKSSLLCLFSSSSSSITLFSQNRYHLKDAVLEGGVPFYKAHGMNAMEYVGKDARFYEVFKSSMEDFHPVLMKKILETYKGFAGLKSLVDVGGGDATILNMIISKYPTINGVNFDLPPVIEKSPSYPGMNYISIFAFLQIINSFLTGKMQSFRS